MTEIPNIYTSPVLDPLLVLQDSCGKNDILNIHTSPGSPPENVAFIFALLFWVAIGPM